MSKIFVVQGSRGEYSDCSEWIVAAFSKAKPARALVKQLNAKEAKKRILRDKLHEQLHDLDMDMDSQEYNTDSDRLWNEMDKVGYENERYFLSETTLDEEPL